MKQAPLDPRSLQNIFYLLLLAQLAFTGVVAVLLNEDSQFIFDTTNLFHWMMPLGIIGLDYIAWRVFQQKVNDGAEEDELIDRVHALQGAYIIQWVMVQAGTFLLLTFAITESNNYYVILAIGQIIYYSTLRPRLLNFIEDS